MDDSSLRGEDLEHEIKNPLKRWIKTATRFSSRNPNWTLLTIGVVLIIPLIILFSIPSKGTMYAGFVILNLVSDIIGYFMYYFGCQWWKRRKEKRAQVHYHKEQHEKDEEEGDNMKTMSEGFIKSLGGLPEVFSLESMKIATEAFSKMIGKGGFGRVYQGNLMLDSNEKLVAVKVLNENENEKGNQRKMRRQREEFCREVATISSVNHANLVRLLGICVEGATRMMVCEFMVNGSLDMWLFNGGPGMRRELTWRRRFCIAVETAKAVAYLHEESRECVMHLDIKPQNVLLDENFHAKVGDFGMARVIDRERQSRVVTSQLRGTPGYMAPEWLLDCGVTTKSDVFSYGMLLLELISGRRNVMQDSGSLSSHKWSSFWYFPSVAMGMVKEGREEEMVDEVCRVENGEELAEVKRCIRSALWCIQGNPAVRPSMSGVVGFLEGELPVMEPPHSLSIPYAPSFRFEGSSTPFTNFNSMLPTTPSSLHQG